MLIKVPRDQLHRVFQLALAIGQGSFAKFADRHGGHGEDPSDQQHAAQGQPQHGSAANRCLPAVLHG
ncbi:hypothetical protein ACVW1A_003139 [Bradyrhizobium sp. LB1.3]